MNKMHNALQKIAAKVRKNRPMANPSICEYQPSVCSCNSENEPFVGKKIPNAPFQPGMRRIPGFTLVELIVAMAVALILISIAFPSFRTLTQNSRMAAQVNDMVADLSFARSEAIKRRTTVSICTSSDGATCSGGNWRDGRIIVGPGAVVLRYREALGATTDTLTTTGPNPFWFDSRGGIPPAIGAFSFTFCDDRGASYGKRVVVNITGQAMLERDAPPATCL
jgi:type IV fimbrial biogenesis protein FimT